MTPTNGGGPHHNRRVLQLSRRRLRSPSCLAHPRRIIYCSLDNEVPGDVQNESSQNAVVDSTDQDVLDGTRTLSVGQLLGLFLNEALDGRVFIDELIEYGNAAGTGGGRAGALGALVAAGETLLDVRNGSFSGGAGRGGRFVGFLILINTCLRSSAKLGFFCGAGCGDASHGGNADRELACQSSTCTIPHGVPTPLLSLFILRLSTSSNYTGQPVFSIPKILSPRNVLSTLFYFSELEAVCRQLRPPLDKCVELKGVLIFDASHGP